MEKLKHSDLYTLEEYDEKRGEMRSQVIKHKMPRTVHIGEHLGLYFEDRRTMHYQIQEILRAEKIFSFDDIAEELATYNPLIPDGSNWKATMMIEYKDPEERTKRLQELIGIECELYIKIGDLEKIYPIANEDLDRETTDKTSAVHFLRFELTSEMVKVVKAGADILFVVEHPHYRARSTASPETRASLVNDLD